MDIHRCRFVDYTPHTVTALAFSHASTVSKPAPASLRLAVGRANGDIEIWDPRHNWSHHFTIPGARGRAIEGLVWAAAAGEQPRLFSIGGLTHVTEWDLHTRRPAAVYDANAGVAWCVDANAAGTQLAVGCDDGAVVLVDIRGGRGVLEHGRMLQKQELRVLGVRFCGDDAVVGGCADGRVRVWDTAAASHGRIVALPRVDRSESEQTVVWLIAAFPERGQFALGDLTGAVKIWDMASFSVVHSFAVHDADVLALARDALGSRLWTAGIDRKIHQFSGLADGGAPFRWVHNALRLLHANDVRAVAVADFAGHGVVVSGGVERLLIVQPAARFAHGRFRKLMLSQQVSNVEIAAASNTIAMFHDQGVKVWRVRGGRHRLVARLRMADDDNVVGVSVGDPHLGRAVLAVATIHAVKLFWLRDTPDGRGVAVAKIRDPDFDAVVPGAKAVVVYGAHKLVVHTADDELYKFTVGAAQVTLDDEIDGVDSYDSPSRGLYASAIRHVVVAPDFSCVVVLFYDRHIEVRPLERSFAAYVLATPASAVQLMLVTPNNTLAALTEDARLYEFNLDSQSARLLTPWSQRNSEVMPLDFLRMDDKPQGLFCHGARVWVYGSRHLAFFDLGVDFTVPKNYAQLASKRAHDGLAVGGGADDDGADDVADDLVAHPLASVADESDDDMADDDKRVAFWFTQKYRPILKAAPFGDHDIAVVEREAFALPTTSAFEAPARIR